MVNGTLWANPFFVLNLENVLSGNSNEHKSAVYHVYVIILFNIVFTPVATWGSLQKQVSLCRLQCKVNQPYSIKKHVYTFPIHNIST